MLSHFKNCTCRICTRIRNFPAERDKRLDLIFEHINGKMKSSDLYKSLGDSYKPGNKTFRRDLIILSERNRITITIIKGGANGFYSLINKSGNLKNDH